MTSNSPADLPVSGHRHLVLLGVGRAHQSVLAYWAVHPVPGVQITLVTPHHHQIPTDLLPGLVARQVAVESCAVTVDSMIHGSGIRWIQQHAAAVDTATQTVVLDDGSQLAYDWLGINTGLTQDRIRIDSDIPGAREFGLFVKPAELFAALWPRVTEFTSNTPRSVIVVGDDPISIELALAIRHRLETAAVTLLTGGGPLAPKLPAPMRDRIEIQLRKVRVTVLEDRLTHLHQGHAVLGCGAHLACHVPILAAGAASPAWLDSSGLALSDEGLISVNGSHQSVSHPNVFASGGICTLPSNQRFASNLISIISGRPARQTAKVKEDAFHMLSCGDGSAIVGWQNLCFRGRWVQRWKERKTFRGVIHAHVAPS